MASMTDYMVLHDGPFELKGHLDSKSVEFTLPSDFTVGTKFGKPILAFIFNPRLDDVKLHGGINTNGLQSQSEIQLSYIRIHRTSIWRYGKRYQARSSTFRARTFVISAPRARAVTSSFEISSSGSSAALAPEQATAGSPRSVQRWRGAGGMLWPTEGTPLSGPATERGGRVGETRIGERFASVRRELSLSMEMNVAHSFARRRPPKNNRMAIARVRTRPTRNREDQRLFASQRTVSGRSLTGPASAVPATRLGRGHTRSTAQTVTFSSPPTPRKATTKRASSSRRAIMAMSRSV